MASIYWLFFGYEKDDDEEPTRTYIREEISDLMKGMEEIRVICIGQTGAGKSSTINSLASVSRKDGGVRRLTVQGGGDQTTQRYFEFPVDWKHGVIFCDVRGFGSKAHGSTISDIIAAIKGDLKHGQVTVKCEENEESASKLRDELPIKDERAYVILIVCDASAFENAKLEGGDMIQKKFKELLEVKSTTDSWNIRRFLILTHMDEVIPELDKDMKLIYESEKAVTIIDDVSKSFNIDQGSILPIVNPVRETYQIPDDIACVLLLAFKKILEEALEEMSSRVFNKRRREKE